MGLLHSSGNTLHALRLVGFDDSIFFDAPSTHQVYSGNTLSHLILESYLGGVNLYGGRCGDDTPCEESGNAWVDMKIIENTIRARGAISVGLAMSSGDRIDNLVIQGKHIFISPENDTSVYDGIHLSSGYGSASTGDEIQNVLIIHNTIEGNPNLGVGLTGGFGGSEAILSLKRTGI